MATVPIPNSCVPNHERLAEPQEEAMWLADAAIKELPRSG